MIICVIDKCFRLPINLIYGLANSTYIGGKNSSQIHVSFSTKLNLRIIIENCWPLKEERRSKITLHWQSNYGIFAKNSFATLIWVFLQRIYMCVCVHIKATIGSLACVTCDPFDGPKTKSFPILEMELD